MSGLMNLARMTSATIGTGTITLGSAVSGCLSFATAAAAAGVASGSTITYGIEDGSQSEVGRGVWTTPNTLTRVTVLASTNGGAKIDLSGNAEVFCMAAAEEFKFSGACVKKSVDQTAANYTAGPVITWDAEHYDTDAFHDTVTENNKLKVPATVAGGRVPQKVRLRACVRSTLGTADTTRTLYIMQDGTTVVGIAEGVEGGSASNGILALSRTVTTLVPGTTYFEAYFLQETDTSITISASDSWFEIEVVD